ncbi:hypothetical protein Vretimale_11112 [Volvox reticuliferus]|uniref:Uncharacterized protein n=1 Tax=Volvox reticuliferus TaxID=1737510 RepID=A0A8J4GH14_9CHLO|nr:hypothetical protein Vretifemale_12837 [Volvox reticuliferus]GIM06870.1 hypothetical protein Vretimale_11112 [Volvox reticuliferus]
MHTAVRHNRRVWGKYSFPQSVVTPDNIACPAPRHDPLPDCPTPSPPPSHTHTRTPPPHPTLCLLHVSRHGAARSGAVCVATKYVRTAIHTWRVYGSEITVACLSQGAEAAAFPALPDDALTAAAAADTCTAVLLAVFTVPNATFQATLTTQLLQTQISTTGGAYGTAAAPGAQDIAVSSNLRTVVSNSATNGSSVMVSGELVAQIVASTFGLPAGKVAVLTEDGGDTWLDSGGSGNLQGASAPPPPYTSARCTESPKLGSLCGADAVGAITGIIAGGLLTLALAVILVVLFLQGRRRRGVQYEAPVMVMTERNNPVFFANDVRTLRQQPGPYTGTAAAAIGATARGIGSGVATAGGNTIGFWDPGAAAGRAPQLASSQEPSQAISWQGYGEYGGRTAVQPGNIRGYGFGPSGEFGGMEQPGDGTGFQALNANAFSGAGMALAGSGATAGGGSGMGISSFYSSQNGSTSSTVPVGTAIGSYNLPYSQYNGTAGPPGPQQPAVAAFGAPQRRPYVVRPLSTTEGGGPGVFSISPQGAAGPYGLAGAGSYVVMPLTSGGSAAPVLGHNSNFGGGSAGVLTEGPTAAFGHSRSLGSYGMGHALRAYNSSTGVVGPSLPSVGPAVAGVYDNGVGVGGMASRNGSEVIHSPGMVGASPAENSYGGRTEYGAEAMPLGGAGDGMYGNARSGPLIPSGAGIDPQAANFHHRTATWGQYDSNQLLQSRIDGSWPHPVR